MKRHGEPAHSDEPPEKVVKCNSYDDDVKHNSVMGISNCIVATATGPYTFNNNLPESANFEDLPAEVLLSIFSWFTVDELCTSVSLVCSKWYVLSRHKGLWKHLRLVNRYGRTYNIVKVLQHATSLETLELIGRSDARPLLLQVASTNRQLRSLVVKHGLGPARTFITADALLSVVTHCPLIEKLVFKETIFGSLKFWKVLGASLPNLKTLICNYNFLLSYEAVGIIVRTCNPLERLSIFCSYTWRARHHTFCDEDIRILTFRMRSTLQVLELNGSNITNDSFKAISTCTQLRTLHIRHSLLVTDSGIIMLSKLPNLTSLRITKAESVSSSGWYDMFRQSNWKGLKLVSLDLCKTVDDHVLEYLGSIYHGLKCVTLRYCDQITKDGFVSLIKECSQLVHLNLIHTNRELTQVFYLLPVYTPLLEVLFYDELYYNIALKPILDELKKQLPNLKIKRNDDPDLFRSFLEYNI